MLCLREVGKGVWIMKDKWTLILIELFVVSVMSGILGVVYALSMQTLNDYVMWNEMVGLFLTCSLLFFIASVEQIGILKRRFR